MLLLLQSVSRCDQSSRLPHPQHDNSRRPPDVSSPAVEKSISETTKSRTPKSVVASQHPDALTVNVQTSGEDGPEAPDENALLNFDEFEALDMPKDEVDRLPSVV